MAADPEVSSALSKIIWYVMPFLVLAAIVNAVTGSNKRSRRRRKSKDDGLLDTIANGIERKIHRRTQKSFFKKQNTLSLLKSLSPDQFEDYISDLFEQLGYSTKSVGGAYDGGVDVIAQKNGVAYYIQCKKFITSQVPVSAVRDFYGAIVDKLSTGKGYFITTNFFTLEAEKFCEDKPIELIDGRKLMEYVRRAGFVEDDIPQAEVCPLDGGNLV